MKLSFLKPTMSSVVRALRTESSRVGNLDYPWIHKKRRYTDVQGQKEGTNRHSEKRLKIAVR